MQALNILENPKLEGEKGTKVQAVKSEQVAVDALYVRPGTAHGPHLLPENDRVIVVLEGSGELKMQTEPVPQIIPLAKGTTVMAPRNTWHAIVNTGASPLVCALASKFPVRIHEKG